MEQCNIDELIEADKVQKQLQNELQAAYAEITDLKIDK